MVHRASSRPDGFRVLDGGWTTFDGEEALVTIIVRDAPVADGGI
jgi:hypothetical protein